MVLANPYEPIEDLSPVLRAVKDRTGSREKEGAVAAWLVKNAAWTEGQRDTIAFTLLARVEKALQSRKPAVFMGRWLFCGMILSLVVWPGCSTWIRWVEGLPGTLDQILASIIAPAFLGLIVSYIAASPPTAIENLTLRPTKRAIELLGKTGGPSCLGALAVAYTHHPLRDVGASALKLVAATVRPEDYGALSGQTVSSLCSARAKADSDTAIVILHVLETVGDERAIDAVERKKTKTWSPEVREVTLRVLVTLRKRADESKTSGTLLRPSSGVPDAQHMLLRATCESGEMHEEQLLRVSED